MDTTTREISQKLRDLKFDGDISGCYNPEDGREYGYPPMFVSTCRDPLNVLIPTYTAQVLFEWFVKNVGKDKTYPYSYYHEDEDGLMLDHLIYGDSNDPNNTWDSPAFKYEESLADMWANGIIWILKQHK